MKKILALFLALILIFSLTACGNSTDPVKDAVDEVAKDGLEGKKAALIVPMATVEALQIICENFVNYCAEKGIEAVTASADVDMAKYMELIENYTADDYDLVCIIPLEAEALADACTKARAEGTKIVIASTIPSYEVDGGLTTDYQACGYAVANMANAWIEKNHPEGGIGVAIVGADSPENYKQCKEAMIATMNGNSKTNGNAYLSNNETGGDVAKGYSFAEEAMTADPTIRVFVCNEPDSAKGINNYLLATYPDKIEEFAVFAINVDETAAGEVMKGMEAPASTALRGLIPYGAEDTGAVLCDIATKVLSGEENYWVFDEIHTLNSFGWEYTAN